MNTRREQGIDRLLLARRVEEFLYHEAALLDGWQVEEWLELLTEDIHYFMPMQRNTSFIDRDQQQTHPGTEIAWFDEGFQTLSQRVQQILTNLHWAEEPISRTTRMISNVLVADPLPNGNLPVSSRLLLYRNRGEEEVDIFAAKREDELVQMDYQGMATFRIRRRKVVLEQNVLLAKNLTLFF